MYEESKKRYRYLLKSKTKKEAQIVMLYDNKYEEIDVGYFNGTEEKENLGIIEELQFILGIREVVM